MSTPVRKPIAELVPTTEADLTITPTVIRSWDVKEDNRQILGAVVEGNLLSVTFASGQSIRLSITQGDALTLALAAWKRVR
jgi:hypothetical protein